MAKRAILQNLLGWLSVLLLCAVTAQAQAQVLLLGAATAPANAKGYLQRLDDPSGGLTPTEAEQSPAWRALPQSLSAGYTSNTVWLQVQVEAQDPGEHRWVMRLSNTLLDDVRLYLRDKQGAWQEQKAGEDLARSQWPIDYRSAVFPLKLRQGEVKVLLVRLQTKNAMSVSLEFAPRQLFSDMSRHEYLGFGLYFGVYLMLIGFHSVFWRMTQAPESGWYLSYVSCCVAVEALTAGLPQQLFRLPVSLSDPLLGIALAVGVPIGVVFAGRQLGLPQVYPRLHRGFATLAWLLCGPAALIVMAGHYRDAMPIVQLTALSLVPLYIGMALWLLVRGHRPARFYLLAFGIYYAGVVISFLRNLGYVPATFWTDNAAAAGTLIHMALMSLRIISHYNRLKQDKQQAQAESARQTLQQNARLESLVAVRVSQLSEEIGRRVLLEQDLRVALEQEQHIRAQQNDFVAMVSHEFRTPLAIINTSAQQLAKHLDAPVDKSQRRCQNIREAGSRLLALVDDYLTHDRMADVQPMSQFKDCDLRALFEDVLAGFEPGRIRFNCTLPERPFICDSGLLHVAVRNLLANADRHAPAGAQIEFELSEQDSAICLSIRHPGEAIPEQECGRLFDKYYRGQQAQRSSGAGLGLYMVQRIAQLHDGDVQLLEAGGQGSICFRMRLQLRQGPAQTAITAVASDVYG